MTLLSHLNWRYATKAYDASKSVQSDALNFILDAIHLAPTSSGLQPFEVLVVSNKDVRAKLRAAAYDQSQVTDASHLLVFAAWDKYTPERISKVFDHTAKERGGLTDSLKAYRDRLIANYGSQDERTNFEHAARQAYIALGVAVAAAAEIKVDTTPMEGFDAKSFDEILGLDKKGLKTAVILAVGYRDAGKDWLVNLKKVRREKKDFFTEVK